jgi:hypothetical protein
VQLLCSFLLANSFCDLEVFVIDAGGSDYNTISSQTVTFPAGETVASFSAGTLPDSIIEGDETFTVTMSNPTGAALGDATVATVSISDRKGAGSDDGL